MHIDDTNMVNKKAFIRTLEAFFAILITIIFVMFSLPPDAVQNKVKPEMDMMDTLAYDESFRACIFVENYTCVDTILRENIHYGYINYTFNISSSYSHQARINRDDVFLKTYFFAANQTAYSPKILKIYYWKE